MLSLLRQYFAIDRNLSDSSKNSTIEFGGISSKAKFLMILFQQGVVALNLPPSWALSR
ncbi:hypothetical protein GOD34_20400 [Sinorhizobium medicae]|nr:hypothetical protein [Sinorhizobium medicae]MDX0615569.1 hypothetical protein [Sinorhizobium medicae]MDX0653121.1 hypothetical protein [Sinorhizobium medicae]MDX1086145.1 hypothetical protein [Sinorhizobium medicae]MDX1111645.1 hypothetical protein [Sinorhizobium medicae]